jgi:large subunit ribosomal protein L18
MSTKNSIKDRARIRRKKHIKKVVHGTSARPRLVVFRSLKHIYAQIVDDMEAHTLASCASNSPSVREKLAEVKNKTKVAFTVGEALGILAKEKGIEKVVFDRNGYSFHGRVKAVAEGARKAGLSF